MRSHLTLLAAIIALLTAVPASAQQGIRWQMTLEAAQRIAAENHQMVLVHFWAPWCGSCRKMEQEVFVDPSVAAVVQTHYVPVKLNADYFQPTTKQFGVTVLPTDVVVTPQGEVVHRIQGFVKASNYAAQLNQVAVKFRASGSGPVYAQVPSGPAQTNSVPQTTENPTARSATASSGVGENRVLNYAAAPPQANAVGAQAAQGSGPVPSNFSGSRGLSWPAATAPTVAPPTAGSTASIYRNDAGAVPPASPYGNVQNAPSAVAANGLGTPYAPPVGPQANVAAVAPAGTSGSWPASGTPGNLNPPANAAPYNSAAMAGSIPANAPAIPAVTSNVPGMGMAPSLPAAAAGPIVPGYGNALASPPSNLAGTPLESQATASALANSPGVKTEAAGSAPLAMDGYCPVRLVEKQVWTLGDRRYGVIHRGRTYLFAGPEEQSRFFVNPDQFSPVLSGSDVVVALEQGQMVPGTREHGLFYGNKIFLFSSEETLDKFLRNPQQYSSAAQQAFRPTVYSPYR